MVHNKQNSCLHFSTIEVYGRKLDPKGGKGINLVALDGQKHKVLLRKAYNTFENKNASPDLIKDYGKIPDGSIIIASVRGQADAMFTPEARAVFTGLGSKEVLKLGAKEGWAFMGIKGQM